MTTTWRAAAVGAVLGAALASGLSCGASPTACNATLCPSGCCDASNVCRPGTALQQCGIKGARCAACNTDQTCSNISGTCTGGTAAGGGTATGGGAATGGGTATGGGAATGGGSATGGGAATGGGSATGGGTGLGALVFNEIAGAGQDFIELYNPSGNAVNVSGYGVADTKSDGGPKVSEALVFPAGTTVEPAGFLLVVLDRTVAGPTSTDCLDGGVSSCFTALFNISNGNGENLYLLNPDSTVAQTQSYPAGAAAAGQSYSRSPDGTGAFSALPVTPGAKNVP